MSVHSSLQAPILSQSSVAVFVLLTDGRKIPAIQIATHQITIGGISEIVKDSIYYTDHDGSEISNVVSLTAESQETVQNITWFYSDDDSLASIYWLDGSFYNADGSVYVGPIASYRSSRVTNAPVTIGNVWIHSDSGDYYSAMSYTEGDRVTYKIDGSIITIASGWTVVNELPAPVYSMRSEELVEGSVQNIPSDYPISGFAISFVVPARTKRSNVQSSVLLGDVVRTISGSVALNSEAPMGTVIPPVVIVQGRSMAVLEYRVRISPIVKVGVPSSSSTTF